MKKELNKLLKKTIYNELFIKDSLFIIGIFIIIIANFIVNLYFGIYFLAFTLIVFSIFLNKSTRKEVKKWYLIEKSKKKEI